MPSAEKPYQLQSLTLNKCGISWFGKTSIVAVYYDFTHFLVNCISGNLLGVMLTLHMACCVHTW